MKRWWDKAACKTSPWTLFFRDKSKNYDEARLICAFCPVRKDCLLEALEEERGLSWRMRSGMWGGKSPKERAKLDKGGRL